MNPYTRSLLKEIDDEDLTAWVQAWDELEALLVDVYRSQASGPDEQDRYRSLRQRLAAEYARWQRELEPHWRGLEAGGDPLESDPFLALLEPAEVDGILDNWQAMQTLPAAREALNNYLIELIESGGLDSRERTGES